jgi:putative FmdB family regulatory protein
MPTYEYACKDCGEHLEVVQSFKDGSLTECPTCGGSLRKVFGNIGITFKGSGFYKTDSRSDGRKGSTKSTEPKTGEATGTGSDKSAESSTSSEKSSGDKSPAPSSSGRTKSSGSSAKGSSAVAAAS